MISHPKLIIGTASFIALFILLSLAQEMNRRWQIQREVQHLESEVQNLEKGVIELEHLNQYFRTPDFQERTAREKLNYRAPGEKVVLIPDQEFTANREASPAEAVEEDISNPLRWWYLFFQEKGNLST